jgi:hypothetical protein
MAEGNDAIVRKLAKQLHPLIIEDETKADMLLAQIVARHGRRIGVAVLEEVARINNFEGAEAEDQLHQHEHDQREIAEATAIFAGLPDGTAFEDACRIKAAQGDPSAQLWVRWFDSREYRLQSALIDAAARLHPLWHDNGGGQFTIDDGAPGEAELVEWLYKNHPREARAVEDAVAP